MSESVNYCQVSGQSTIEPSSWTITTDAGTCGTAWGYWTEYYYPNIIHVGYPIYYQEKALDKGKKAFEIVKILKDKKLVTINRVSQFIDLMDELIKIL